MPVADTSKATYRAIKPDLQRRRARILSIIRDWPTAPGPTTAEIAARLGIPDNQVSGRITELLGDGLIRIAARKHNPTGKTARAYAVIRSSGQLTLF